MDLGTMVPEAISAERIIADCICAILTGLPHSTLNILATVLGNAQLILIIPTESISAIHITMEQDSIGRSGRSTEKTIIGKKAGGSIQVTIKPSIVTEIGCTPMCTISGIMATGQNGPIMS